MVRYWLVKHDKVSVEKKPGWIWRTVGMSKWPNSRQVARRDKFVQYSYETDATENHQPTSQIYGFYRVTKPREKRRVYGEDVWVIEGQPILQKGWIAIPKPERFYATEKFTRQSIVSLTQEEYEKFLAYYTKFIDAKWGIFEREPENEQQVIVLFTYYMHKLGYKAYKELGRRETPDAVLISETGREVPVEFEYTSRGLERHSLAELKNTRCICWVDDLPPGSRYLERVKVEPIKQRLFEIINPHAVWHQNRLV